MPSKKKKAQIATYTHPADTRRNIPTAEVEPAMDEDKKKPITLEYERSSRNTDLDPQLVWKGKDEQDQTDLVVTAPPIFIQEKVHPRVLIEDLLKQSSKEKDSEPEQMDLFSDFNGLEDQDLKSDYYEHEQNWSNRMILGDSLQVLASLASREGYQGKVQCIYMDPPYGISFNSNFQWSTTSNGSDNRNDVRISREPEQVKAFRDTWRDGIHSYLTYLRDRLTVARELLTDSGSIFVQIGDENVHRVRSLLDEVFGHENFVSLIQFRTKIPLNPIHIGNVCDFILWYGKSKQTLKFRRLFQSRPIGSDTQFRSLKLESGVERNWTKQELEDEKRIPDGSVPFRLTDLVASGFTESCHFSFDFQGKSYYPPGTNSWKTTPRGMERLKHADRIRKPGRIPSYQFRFSDYPMMEFTNQWNDTQGATGKTYVVQTSNRVIQRCILMTTDPGDLVLDPTCGAGTSAYVAEQWGRRWITIDTSRVALALARTRIMGARYPYFLLADSQEGKIQEAKLSRGSKSEGTTQGNIHQGFVYARAPHITIGSIANNAEIDVIYAEFQEKMEPVRKDLNRVCGTHFEEWEIPRETDESWPEEAQVLHKQWWSLRTSRQKEIDNSIAVQAESELLHDKPYEDRSKVRVAGPFTVESLSPHRLLVSSEAEETDTDLLGSQSKNGQPYEGTAPEWDFAAMVIENLRTAGVQQANKGDKIDFNSIGGWPGEYICAQAEYTEGESEKRAGIFVGPEFGTVGQPDLNAAAREAARAGFDVLISCAFSYDAHATELNRMGALPILKARMNAELQMDTDLKNTGQGNLFVIFGEPDITLEELENEELQVKIKGVDIYDPSTGQVRSDDTDGIACWFIDTDYNEESFFVRHAYFLGANDPYKALKTTLKTEIDKEAWESLNSDVSRPFPKPESGRIAVKVINHLGDEAMKVIRV